MRGEKKSTPVVKALSADPGVAGERRRGTGRRAAWWHGWEGGSWPWQGRTGRGMGTAAGQGRGRQGVERRWWSRPPPKGWGSAPQPRHTLLPTAPLGGTVPIPTRVAWQQPSRQHIPVSRGVSAWAKAVASPGHATEPSSPSRDCCGRWFGM